MKRIAFLKNKIINPIETLDAAKLLVKDGEDMIVFENVGIYHIRDEEIHEYVATTVSIGPIGTDYMNDKRRDYVIVSTAVRS